MRLVARTALRAFAPVLRALGAGRLARLLGRLLMAMARSLPAEEAIRFLLDLDNRLYAEEGFQAVRYGRGVHPKHRLLAYHDFFIARIEPDECVLDIGCGHGEVARAIALQTGARVTGMDLDGEKIAAARQGQADNLHFIHGDALADLPVGPFDVVVLSNVLEHLETRAAFLGRLRRAVAPKRILVRVPLFERDWRVPLKRELGLEWRLDSTHFTEYTLESFAMEVAAAGLRIVHLEVRWGEIWSELCPQV